MIKAMKTRALGRLRILCGLAIAIAGPSTIYAGTLYSQINLVASDPSIPAGIDDPNLRNPWGIASSGTSPFWVADNGNGLSTLYNTGGTTLALVVTIPPPPGSTNGAPSNPTGVVFNGNASGFNGANGSKGLFIFATEGGTINTWNSGTFASTSVDNSSSGAVYKGLAIGPTMLYAANFHAGTIDTFNSAFAPVSPAGGFVDTTLPAGFAPFNIQNLAGKLYVTYAKQDSAGHDEVAGPGLGFVDVFDLNGNFIQRIGSGGTLNAPWGLAIAPAGFGDTSGDLLVGNFGDGRINVFTPLGIFLGQLQGTSGPITIPGLWGLLPGNGGQGGLVNDVYFTAGPADETKGLVGALAVNAVPLPPAVIPGVALLAGLAGFKLLGKRSIGRNQG